MIKGLSPALQMNTVTHRLQEATLWLAVQASLPMNTPVPQGASSSSQLPQSPTRHSRTSTACGCSAVFQGAGAEDVMGVGAKPELGGCHCVHLILLVWQLRYELRAFQ